MPHDVQRLKREVKQVLQYLKIMRSQPLWVRCEMVGNDAFDKEVMDKLEQVLGWTDQDEEGVRELVEQFNAEMQGRGVNDKRARLKTILKVAGSAVGTVSAVGVLIQYLKRRRKSKAED